MSIGRRETGSAEAAIWWKAGPERGATEEIRGHGAQTGPGRQAGVWTGRRESSLGGDSDCTHKHTHSHFDILYVAVKYSQGSLMWLWVCVMAQGLEKNMSCLVGDCLLAAAFLSYMGPFLSNYRDELVTNIWMKQVSVYLSVILSFY